MTPDRKDDVRVNVLSLRLRTALRTPNGPTQKEIALGANVSQPVVSRLAAGRLRRFTTSVERIEQWLDQNIIASTSRGSLADVLDAYLADGYDPELLAAQIKLLRRAQSIPGPGKR